MSRKRGICLISVPKSGTMFVSRYLAGCTGAPVVFGLEGCDAPTLLRQLEAGWHPDIAAAATQGSADIHAMTRRFAQMLARNRSHAGSSSSPVIYSDHGLASFLSFLINPQPSDVQDPAQVCAWAAERQLAPVFLYRDIRAVANSLAQFLAGRKSFLLGLRSQSDACNLVVRLHAPVLAELTRKWRAEATKFGVQCVSYEALMSNPGRWLDTVCRHGGLPTSAAVSTDAPQLYRSWTYRRGGGDWTSTFTREQQVRLGALAEPI